MKIAISSHQKISRTIYTPIYQFLLYLRIISSGTSKLPASVADDTDIDNEKEINHRNNYFSINNNCIFNGTF
jgi:hypothetical protein